MAVVLIGKMVHQFFNRLKRGCAAFSQSRCAIHSVSRMESNWNPSSYFRMQGCFLNRCGRRRSRLQRVPVSKWDRKTKSRRSFVQDLSTECWQLIYCKLWNKRLKRIMIETNSVQKAFLRLSIGGVDLCLTEKYGLKDSKTRSGAIRKQHLAQTGNGSALSRYRLHTRTICVMECCPPRNWTSTRWPWLTVASTSKESMSRLMQLAW